MTDGIRAFRKLQLGKENTAGTAVAATYQWRGEGTMEDGTQRNYVDEAVGIFMPTDRSYEPFTIAKLAMEEAPVTFESLPYILCAGVKSVTTGVADGSGSGKIYTFPISLTSLNTLKTFTLEAGDNNQAWEAAYGLVTDFNISGAGGGDSDACMVSANWIAREWSTTTFTALSLAAVTEAVFPKAKFYIDAIGGTIGTTQKTGTLIEFSLDWVTGVNALFAADGQLYFSDAALRARPEVTCEVKMVYGTNAQVQVANWLAGTSVQIEIKLEGPTFNTAGTAYSCKTIKMQLPGSWEKFSGLEDVEGGDIITGTFRSGYNLTSATGPQIIVVNTLASLT